MSVLASIRQRVGLSPTKAGLAAPAASSSSPSTSSSTLNTSANASQVTSSSDNAVYGYLVLESSKGAEKGRFPLRKKITTVGRMQQCDIRIYQETVSRQHCQICIEDGGKANLLVLNPRGVRINRQKVQNFQNFPSDSANGNIISCPLEESDLVEIFQHFFRLEYTKVDEDSRLLQASKEKAGRKSLRMSLLQTASDHSNTAGQLDNEEEKGVEEEVQHLEPSTSPVKKFRSNTTRFEEEKENAPIQSRRSFALSTPSRPVSNNGPWETEPRKRKVRRESLSPVKGAYLQASKESMHEEEGPAIVVMEEMDEEEKGRVAEEQLHDSEEGTPDVPLELTQEESRLEILPPPPLDEEPPQQQTKIVSPKKAKRRSSFFGRAGIFAGINLGFYPEERKEEREQKEVENDLQNALISPPTSPKKQFIPEPRLDDYGMPRLPRSLSSPSGLNYGSPGKRRNISLRTATLLRAGQQAFEQQKLLSPPTSPTKSSSTSDTISLMTLTSPEKRAAAGEIPLPDSENDAEDEDEVDKSLDSLTDEQEDEAKAAEAVAPLPRYEIRTGPRRSHGVIDSYKKGEKAEAKRASRMSMPCGLGSASVDKLSRGKIVSDWQREWQGKKADETEEEQPSIEECEPAEMQCPPVDVLEGVQNQDIDGNEAVIEKELAAEQRESPIVEQIEMGNQSDALEKPTEAQIEEQPVKDIDDDDDDFDPSLPYARLRHMVRDSPKLTALLVDVTSTPLSDKVIDGDVSTLELPALDTSAVVENSQSRSEAAPPFIPRELQGTTIKPARRASEQPVRKSRRRSSHSLASKTPKSRSRKSAAGVLTTSSVLTTVTLPAAEEEPIPILDDEWLPKEASSTVGPSMNSPEITRPESHTEESSTQPSEVVVPTEDATKQVIDEDVECADSDDDVEEEGKVDPPKRSPRKRTATIINTQIPIPTRQSRAAKLAATAAILGETVSSKERQASESPQKKQQSNRAISRQAFTTSDDALTTSDGYKLVMEPSSPTKRIKRAAKNAAEVKIKATLTKKQSVTVLRDARSLSEVGRSGASTEKTAISKKNTTKTTTTTAITRSSRLLRKRTESAIDSIQSEPTTRTTRSRTAVRKL